jgi:hypothetical protein
MDELDLLASPAPMPEPSMLSLKGKSPPKDTRVIADNFHHRQSLIDKEREDLMQAADLISGDHDLPRDEHDGGPNNAFENGAKCHGSKRTPSARVSQGDDPTAANIHNQMAQASADTFDTKSRNPVSTPSRPMDDVLLMFGLSPSIFKDRAPTQSGSRNAEIPQPIPLTPQNLDALKGRRDQGLDRTQMKQDAFIAASGHVTAQIDKRSDKQTSFVSTEVDFAEEPVTLPARPSARRVKQDEQPKSTTDGTTLSVELPKVPDGSLRKQQLLSAAHLSDSVSEMATTNATMSFSPDALTGRINAAEKQVFKTPEPLDRARMDIPLPRAEVAQELWPRLRKRKRSAAGSSHQEHANGLGRESVVEESPQARPASRANPAQNKSPAELRMSPKNLAEVLRVDSIDVTGHRLPGRKVRPSPGQKLPVPATAPPAPSREALDPIDELLQTPVTTKPLVRSSSARKRLSDDVQLDAPADDGRTAQSPCADGRVSKASYPRTISRKQKNAANSTPTLPNAGTHSQIAELSVDSGDELAVLEASTPESEQLQQRALTSEQKQVRQRRRRPKSAVKAKSSTNQAGADSLRNLEIFGKQPTSLPRNNRQRRSPGAWWAADVRPKEEEDDPKMAKRGPGRSSRAMNDTSSALPAQNGHKQACNVNPSSLAESTPVGIAKHAVNDSRPPAQAKCGEETEEHENAHNGAQRRQGNNRPASQGSVHPVPKSRMRDSRSKKRVKTYKRASRQRLYDTENDESDDLVCNHSSK